MNDSLTFLLQTPGLAVQFVVILGQAHSDLSDRLLQVVLTLFVILEDADAKRLESFNHLFPKDPESFRRVRGDEDAFAVGEQMPKQIRDSVSLTCTWRPLNQDTVTSSELARDF
jgi:hypothetical protein